MSDGAICIRVHRIPIAVNLTHLPESRTSASAPITPRLGDIQHLHVGFLLLQIAEELLLSLDLISTTSPLRTWSLNVRLRSRVPYYDGEWAASGWCFYRGVGIILIFKFFISFNLYVFFEIGKGAAEGTGEGGVVGFEEGPYAFVVESVGAGRDKERLSDCDAEEACVGDLVGAK
jgi:hypothetical protein